MSARAAVEKWIEKLFQPAPGYMSRVLSRHKLLTCNKDISYYLAGYQVPYVMEYLSREILLRADTPLLFQQTGQATLVRPVGEHFVRKGTLPEAVADDVHEACALYKRWLRTLRQPILPLTIQKSLVERLAALDRMEEWHLTRLAERALTDREHQYRLEILSFIHCIFFLQQITRHRNRNFMTAKSLAAIFVQVIFRYEALEWCQPPVNGDPRHYYAIQDQITVKVIAFMEFLISGKGNSVLRRILRHLDEPCKNIGDRLTPYMAESVRTPQMPQVPAEARNALQTTDEPVLLMWRSHSFDEVPSVREHSPVRMTFIREIWEPPAHRLDEPRPMLVRRDTFDLLRRTRL